MYKIVKVSPSGSGERLLLSLVSPDGDKESIAISCDGYRALDLKKGELSDEKYKALSERSDKEEALLKGMRILGFGANSPRQLEEKLCRGGISRDVARETAKELVRRGYLNENEDAARLSEALFKKGYGRKRIIAALRAKGYSQAALDVADQAMSELDFERACIEVARKKIKNLTPDRASAQKAIAKLVGLGYNVSEAKSAVEALLRKE